VKYHNSLRVEEVALRQDVVKLLRGDVMQCLKTDRRKRT
jgi:hypothetical protein